MTHSVRATRQRPVAAGVAAEWRSSAPCQGGGRCSQWMPLARLGMPMWIDRPQVFLQRPGPSPVRPLLHWLVRGTFFKSVAGSVGIRSCGDFGGADHPQRKGNRGASTVSTRNRRRPWEPVARRPSHGLAAPFRAPRRQRRKLGSSHIWANFGGYGVHRPALVTATSGFDPRCADPHPIATDRGSIFFTIHRRRRARRYRGRRRKRCARCRPHSNMCLRACVCLVSYPRADSRSCACRVPRA